MRPTTIAVLFSLLAAPVFGQAGDRYGGSSSSFDIEKAFEGLGESSSSATAGGYRSQPSPPTSSTNNQLRQPPERTLAPPPTRTVTPPPASRSSSADLRSRPPQTRSPSRSASAAAAPPSRQTPSSRATGTVEAGPREVSTRSTLQKMLRPHRSSQLRGNSTSLARVLSSASARDEQTQLVDAYWALTSTVADYYLGLYEIDELQRLRSSVSAYSKPLGEAQIKLRTRLDTSLKAAKAAQYRLSRLTGSPAMALPADTPFTGPYETRLAAVFPQGAPQEARLLHELLPLRLTELYDAADSLNEYEKWIDRVSNDPGRGASGEGLINALKLNALNRRAFVMLARDYNLQINRYTQLAAPGEVDTDRLVAMLIRTDPAAYRGERSLIAGSGRGDQSASRNLQSRGPARR